MAISGNWVLHYSWGCTGTYGQVTLTFNNDGTFSGALSGKFFMKQGTFILVFDNGPAVYGGTIAGSVGSGGMSTFAGFDGCWYLTKEGIVGLTGGRTAGAQAANAAGVATGATAVGGLDASGTAR